MKRMLSIMLSLMVIAGVFAGCGSDAASSTVAASVPGKSAQEAEAEIVVSIQETKSAAEEETASQIEASVAEGPAHELPLTDENIEFTLFTGMNPNLMGVIDTYAETGIFQWLEETTGIHVNIPAVHPASQQEQWNLMAASGDYTDILGEASSYPTGLTGALDDEVIYDLRDFEDEMPLYFGVLNGDESIRKDCSQDDGAVAATYRILSNDDFYPYTSGPLIRSDWLRELGLEAPETYDEYYDVLTAFKNEYGATMWFSANETPFTSLGFGIRAGYFFGMNSGLDCFYLDGDKVVCGFLQDEFKDYIALMQKWYAEGLLNTDFASMTSRFVSGMGDEFSAVINGEHGIWVDEAPVLSSYQGYDNFEMEAIPVPRKTKGEVLNTTFTHYTKVDGLKFSLSTTCAYPELAAQWLDCWYSDEATVVCNWGVEGDTFTYDEDGNPHFTEKITNNPDGLAMGFARELYTAPTGGYLQDHGTQYSMWGDLEYSCVETWGKNNEDTTTIPSFISLTVDEKTEFNSYSGDIITYVSENLSKLIIGELNLEDGLDTFVKTIKDMGIERCIELQQAAYDRYLQR